VVEVELLALADVEAGPDEVALQALGQVGRDRQLAVRDRVVVARPGRRVGDPDAEDRDRGVPEDVVVVGRVEQDDVGFGGTQPLGDLAVQRGDLLRSRSAVGDDRRVVRRVRDPEAPDDDGRRIDA
jgi:hypothetical protein